MKYAMSYLVIFVVVLLLLNTYPVLASQDLLFASKRDSLKSQTAVMASALMELESLSSDQVARVMNMLDSMGLTRILVTDPAGLILYDSTNPGPQELPEGESPPPQEYRYALYQEVVSALRGSDVFYSRYTDRVFTSTAAMPIVYRGMVIGSIYILEVDQAQGELLYSLQQNLRTISLVIAAVTLVMSTLFSKVLTARIAALLRAFRIVGEGEYGHRLQPVGRDELAQLAGEFNSLTDRLQATEEVRRRFVSDASHELKTPLASIRLLADSILQTDEMDPEMVQDFVTDIGAEAERLTRITEHLLSLSRLDSLPVGDAWAVDVSQVTERIVSLLQPVADAAGVSVEQNLKPGCVVLCTEDDLSQICFNLVENAIKYNYPGGKVFLSVYPDGDQILLEVGDTGVGIPEEDLPKVFNRFYRVDKARSRAAGGTGLGLSIVRDTVRRHGGWVTARPRNPEGSLFTAGLPRCEPKQDRKGAEQ
ncbi:MAG: HAMP domain-containing histidine kinase [Lawsonibacter sp.]|nr:HAMP domain-containing histidine kinase [Lawsonibacter sp.]